MESPGFISYPSPMRTRIASISLLLLGCSGTPSSSGLPWEVVDSAGVEIVTSNISLDEQQGQWLVSDEPRLVIGTDPANPDQVIHWVRGVVRLSDGRITLISESSKDLKVFNGSGALIQVVGKDGDGPGEFRAPLVLSKLPGDTLVVTERGSNRRSWFSPQGAFTRRVIPDRAEAQSLAPAGFAVGFGFFVPPNGALWELEELRLGPIGSRYRLRRGYVLVPSTDADPVLIGWFQGLEHFFAEQGLGQIAFLARDTHVAVGGDPTRIYIGDSQRFEIQRFDSEGNLEQIIRDSQPPSPLEDRDIEWERRALLDWGKTSGMLQEFTRLADAMPIPEHRPAFETFLVDSVGYLWVKEYSSQRPGPIRYRIYSPDGKRVGVVQLPGRLLVFDIGVDYILGRHADLDDVETIQLFDLTRQAGTSIPQRSFEEAPRTLGKGQLTQGWPRLLGPPALAFSLNSCASILKTTGPAPRDLAGAWQTNSVRMVALECGHSRELLAKTVGKGDPPGGRFAVTSLRRPILAPLGGPSPPVHVNQI